MRNVGPRHLFLKMIISFIRKNLNSITTDEAASTFSLTGQHKNIDVRYVACIKTLEGIFLHYK